MNCQEYVALMSEYADREMQPSERDQFEEHFNNCPPCREFFKSFESSLELLEFIRNEPCPQEVAARLERLLREKAKARAAGPR